MMVKKVLILLFFIALFSSFTPPDGDNLKWYDWNEGYPIALTKKKIVLVDAYTEWCGWCKKMDKDTYTNAEVIKKLNEHFIVIKFNPELSELKYNVDSVTYSAQDFFAQLTRGENTGFPTTYFINPSKKSLMIDPGYHDAASFLLVLDRVIADSKGK
ncbi:MAG: DUF255 domain-containing protein [Bacteroidia bacterium]|nr:DUF255 domain-containing protein [Bacteroidia bacterium]